MAAEGRGTGAEQMNTYFAVLTEEDFQTLTKTLKFRAFLFDDKTPALAEAERRDGKYRVVAVSVLNELQTHKKRLIQRETR